MNNKKITDIMATSVLEEYGKQIAELREKVEDLEKICQYQHAWISSMQPQVMGFMDTSRANMEIMRQASQNGLATENIMEILATWDKMMEIAMEEMASETESHTKK